MESVSTRRSTLILFFLLFLVAAITATLYLVQKRQEIRPEAAPITEVTLVPQLTSVTEGQNVTFDVVVNTDTDTVTAITMDINYDPQYLEATDIVARTGGVFPINFDNHDKNIDNNNGVAHLSLGYDYNSGSGFQGTDTVAHVTFLTKLATNQTTVSFSGNTRLATVLNTSNYLEANLIAGSVVITAGQQTAADSTVSVTTDKSSYNVGDIVTATVSVNPGNNALTGTDITVDFNKDLLEGLSASIANNFSYCQSGATGNFSNGQIRMQLCINNLQTPMTTTGTLFTLTFKALTSGTTNININDVSQISGQGSSANLIKSKQNTSITIGSGDNNNNNNNNSNNPYTCPNSRPIAPTNLKASVGTDNQVKLTWTQVSSNVTHYGIKYGIKSKDYLYGASNIGNTNAFTVGGLTKGYTYYFTVFAVNDCIAGEDSGEASINLTAGTGGGIFGAKTSPLPKNAIPSPAAGFKPLPKSSTNPFLTTKPQSSVTPLPKINIPAKNATQSGFMSSPFALYGGIFLIILALFLGIYFFRMRRY